MAETFVGRRMDGAQFRDCALAGARFEDVRLSDAVFTDVDLSGARLTDVDLSGVSIDEASIDGLTLCGHDIPKLIAGARESGTSAPTMLAEPQLFVSDMDAAFAFYRDALGFRLAFVHGEPPFYAQVRRGGWRLNLRRVDQAPFADGFREREADALSATLVLDDVRPLHAEYEAAGLAFHQTLRAEPWGALTFILGDPDGNLIAFAGRAEPGI